MTPATSRQRRVKRFTLRTDAYTVEAIIACGIPAEVVKTWIASGPRAKPERALVKVGGRRRTVEPIAAYVWGPDAMAFYANWRASIARET